ncbi:MAG TPA: bacillithiol biosynthesis cysteine-adding enzyme BshC [Candidatus Kapabacteria bacterium]|jgi:bacillithiol biosynthesis cysteine-adding enzyme BshC|nr:bacillithiol biosynthesis cysteine-adding enzyme BshC [Candidatus Kapabacteria bacterium]
MNIASIPYFTPLVKDYLTRFVTSPIQEYFAIAPVFPHEQIAKLLDERHVRERALPPAHRQAVVASIYTLHKSLGHWSNAAQANLKLLESTDTFAVVTGQQVGIFGGPLYSFYKTLTCIALVKKLREQFPGRSFVPVFWLETEDHDLEETSVIRILNREGELQTLQYIPTEASENTKWRKQVGPLLLEEQPLAAVIEQLQAALLETTFTSEVLAAIQKCYAPGKTFGDAFAALLLEYFGDDGLLLFDSGSHEMKSLVRDLIWREIETTPQLSEQIVRQSGHLEEKYHAQVKPRALNLFYLDDNGDRLPIVEHEKSAGQSERTFFLKGARKTFTLTELRSVLDTQPERFSPNVVLRPLCQDTLLPTVSYVAGPGEIAYFAQFGPAYEWAGLPMPLIAPRLTATLIEERFERIFKKFKIEAEDVLSEIHGQNKTLFDSLIDSDLNPRFEHTIEAIDRELESLRPTVVHAEPTLDGALTSLKGKLLTAVRDFHGKTLAAERKRHTTTKTQLDKLLTALLPNNELQERELNLIYFLNKYGMGFLQTLKQALEPLALESSEHHLIHLDKVFAIPPSESDGHGRTSDAAMPLGAVLKGQI